MDYKLEHDADALLNKMRLSLIHICYAFSHLYGKREGVSPEVLMEECVRDMEQEHYYCHKELNQAIAQHLMQGDLQENCDKL